MNQNTNYKVKNIGGSQGDRYKGTNCPCTSWLQHWKHNTSNTRNTCAVVPCSDAAVHGAHVRIQDGRIDDCWYIVPMCASHNNPNNQKEMFLDSRVTLVDLSKTSRCSSSQL